MHEFRNSAFVRNIPFISIDQYEKLTWKTPFPHPYYIEIMKLTIPFIVSRDQSSIVVKFVQSLWQIKLIIVRLNSIFVDWIFISVFYWKYLINRRSFNYDPLSYLRPLYPQQIKGSFENRATQNFWKLTYWWLQYVNVQKFCVT